MADEASLNVISSEPAAQEQPSTEHRTQKPTDLEEQQQLRPHPRDGWAPWKWKGFVLLSILMVLTGGYDVSNVANIQSPLFEAFGHIELLSWITLSYALGTTAFIPFFRKLAAFCDLRVLWLISGAIFFVGTVVDGAAHSMAMVIIGRVITGVGVAGALQCLVIYQAMFSTPSELPRLQGLFALCYAVGLISGPIIGGAFSENEHATWRWAFYIVLPFLGTVFEIVWHVAPSVKLQREPKPLYRNLLAFDWLGWLLHAATFVLLSLALVFSGATWEWNSGPSIAVWVLLGVCFVAYVIHQSVFAANRDRLLPIKVLSERRVFLASFSTVMTAMSFATFLYYTPLFLAFGLGFSPLDAAVRLLPFIFTFIFSGVMTGALLPIVGRYAVFYVTGSALILLGSGLMSSLDRSVSVSRVMGYEAIVGLGAGLTFQTSLGVTSFGRPPAERLDTAMLQTMSQQTGILLALGMAGCIFQNLGFQYMQEALQGKGFSDQDIRTALAGLASPIWLKSSPEVALQAADAVTRVISKLFYIPVAASALALVAGCCMRWEKLDFKGARQAAVRAAAAVEMQPMKGQGRDAGPK